MLTFFFSLFLFSLFLSFFAPKLATDLFPGAKAARLATEAKQDGFLVGEKVMVKGTTRTPPYCLKACVGYLGGEVIWFFFFFFGFFFFFFFSLVQQCSAVVN